MSRIASKDQGLEGSLPVDGNIKLLHFSFNPEAKGTSGELKSMDVSPETRTSKTRRPSKGSGGEVTQLTPPFWTNTAPNIWPSKTNQPTNWPTKRDSKVSFEEMPPVFEEQSSIKISRRQSLRIDETQDIEVLDTKVSARASFTAFDFAALCSHEESLSGTLDHGSGMNSKITAGEDYTAFDVAAIRSHAESLRGILDGVSCAETSAFEVDTHGKNDIDFLTVEVESGPTPQEERQVTEESDDASQEDEVISAAFRFLEKPEKPRSHDHEESLRGAVEAVKVASLYTRIAKKAETFRRRCSSRSEATAK